MIIILLFAFLLLADLSYQPEKYVVKRNLLALKKSQWLKDLHDEIFILRSNELEQQQQKTRIWYNYYKMSM